MARVLVLAAIAFGIHGGVAAQALSTLRIKVVVADDQGTQTPVPRHALLVSDNPPTATPRLIVTGIDGTVEVRVRAGTYTVESDQPVTFQGKAYTWTQMVDVPAGRDAVLELTAANAEVESAGAVTATPGAPLESDPAFLLPKWQDSVVALWTATTRGSGFVIDGNGLIATSQRVIGTATSVEVQLTPAVKVAGAVLATDPARDVAVIRIDPAVIASARPMALSCDPTQRRSPADGDEIFAMGVPLRQGKSIGSATVSRADAQGLVAEFRLGRGSAGGPVMTARGDLVGILSAAGENDRRGHEDYRVVRLEAACDVVAAAQTKLKDAVTPSGARLPVDPERPFPIDALRAALERGTTNVSAYQFEASAFDVTLLTPVLTYIAYYQSQRPRPRTTSADTRKPEPERELVQTLLDFANWSDYVGDFPPVLLVRVTPRLVEGFWTRVARGAASTQGVSIPAIKRPTSNFSRLRAYCGDAEITPIHPFKLEHRISENDRIYEGLYAFAPEALGPHCAAVTLQLYSEKEPDKADTRVVDPKIVQQIWEDFAPYRQPRR